MSWDDGFNHDDDSDDGNEDREDDNDHDEKETDDDNDDWIEDNIPNDVIKAIISLVIILYNFDYLCVKMPEYEFQHKMKISNHSKISDEFHQWMAK